MSVVLPAASRKGETLQIGSGLGVFVQLTCVSVSKTEAVYHDAADENDLVVVGNSQVWCQGVADEHILTIGGNCSNPYNNIRLCEYGVGHMRELVRLVREPGDVEYKLHVVEAHAGVKLDGQNANIGSGVHRVGNGDEISVLNTTWRMNTRKPGDDAFVVSKKRNREVLSGVVGTESCSVCFVALCTTSFLPCGHRCVCETCAPKIMRMGGRMGHKCPHCCQWAESYHKIYLAGRPDDASAGASASRDGAETPVYRGDDEGDDEGAAGGAAPRGGAGGASYRGGAGGAAGGAAGDFARAPSRD